MGFYCSYTLLPILVRSTLCKNQTEELRGLNICALESIHDYDLALLPGSPQKAGWGLGSLI